MMQGNERRRKADGMVEVDDTPERLERRQEGRMVKRLEQRFGRLKAWFRTERGKTLEAGAGGGKGRLTG
jgi:hypothetical protein